jgi:8-hydroxy-5-deazaflavin:NADPH oxidoreductase
MTNELAFSRTPDVRRRMNMSISNLGAGNMAKGLAARFASAGHPVTLASRDETKADAAAREVGNGVSSAPIAAAAQSADMVILAVPFDSAGDVIAAAGGFAGKIVVDIPNPMTADFSGLSIGHTTSAAVEIQKRAPQAKVVKAFNTIFAQVLQNGGQAAGRPATVFVAGDDEAARAAVVELARGAGFETLETGVLSSARYLEPVAALNITLGYGLGHGTDIAPTWQRAA